MYPSHRIILPVPGGPGKIQSVRFRLLSKIMVSGEFRYFGSPSPMTLTPKADDPVTLASMIGIMISSSVKPFLRRYWTTCSPFFQAVAQSEMMHSLVGQLFVPSDNAFPLLREDCAASHKNIWLPPY